MEDNYFNTAHLGLTQSINNSFIRNESSYYLVPTFNRAGNSRCYYSYNGNWTIGYRVVRMNYAIYYNINEGFITDNTKADYILFPVLFKTENNFTSTTYFGIAYYCNTERSTYFDFYYDYYDTYNSGFCSLAYSSNGGTSSAFTASLVETSNNFNQGFLVDNASNHRVRYVEPPSNKEDYCYVSKWYSFGSGFNYQYDNPNYKIYLTGYDSSHLIRAYTSPTKNYADKRFTDGFDQGKISGGSGGLSLIGESFEKMGSLLSIQILPNFTIGALISIPLMFILLTFMIRMFKGGN